MFIPILNRLLHWFVIGIGTTVMSLMILSKGTSMASLGVVVGLYSSVIVVLEVPSGILSDRFGRKRIYLLSLGLSILGYGFLVFAEGFWPVLAAFCLLGAARAFSSGSIETIFLNEYSRKNGKENLHRLVSAMLAGEAAGLAVGALAGGLIPIAWNAFFPGTNRYSGNLIVQILILLVLAAFTMSTTRETVIPRDCRSGIGAQIRESLRPIGDSGILKPMLLGFAAWGLCFSSIETYWQPRLRDMLGSDAETWIFGLVNAGYFLASLLGVFLANRLLARRRMSYFTFLFAIRLAISAAIVVLSFQTGVVSFTVVYLVMFLMNGMGGVPENSAFNCELPDDRRSSLLSVASLAAQLGGIMASLTFSALVDRLGIPAIWGIAGVLFGLSSFVYLLAGKRSSRIVMTVPGSHATIPSGVLDASSAASGAMNENLAGLPAESGPAER
jgi:MFS family permease